MTQEHIFNKFLEFKDNLFNSKRYWSIYLVLILSYFLFCVCSENCFNNYWILFIFLFSFIGIFCISYVYGYGYGENLYKSVFLIILIFGIIISFLMPILSGPDEVEHFVRAEMTSRGEFIPEYNETPFVYEGFHEKGFYLTIRSTFDLINTKPVSISYDHNNFFNVFATNILNKPINGTLVKYHSAFAQNPFFGYIAPALGMLIAKSLNLNAVWLVWLGRLANIILYAGLISLSIKKTPILKVPLLIIACIPLALVQASSLSIDSLINGLAILSISYFFEMCFTNDLTYKHIIDFSCIVLLLGLCKVTYFSFIFLLLFVPIDNFNEKKYYFLGFLSIFILASIALLWSNYTNYVMCNSYRFIYFEVNNVNVTEQLQYILSHKLDAFVMFCNSFFDLFSLRLSLGDINCLFLLFLFSMSIFYPQSKFNLKAKIGALLIFLILYGGSLVIMLLIWTPVASLDIIGFQSRYIFPALGLLPFIMGINNRKWNLFNVDLYLICFMISFISFNLIELMWIY